MVKAEGVAEDQATPMGVPDSEPEGVATPLATPLGVVVECGGGVQRREVTCVRTRDHMSMQDERCAHVQPPPTVQR